MGTAVIQDGSGLARARIDCRYEYQLARKWLQTFTTYKNELMSDRILAQSPKILTIDFCGLIRLLLQYLSLGHITVTTWTRMAVSVRRQRQMATLVFKPNSSTRERSENAVLMGLKTIFLNGCTGHY